MPDKKRFTVVFTVAELYVDVEAESEEDAEQAAWERIEAEDIEFGLCHFCAGKVEPCDPYLASIHDGEEPDHA